MIKKKASTLQSMVSALTTSKALIDIQLEGQRRAGPFLWPVYQPTYRQNSAIAGADSVDCRCQGLVRDGHMVAIGM